jgi:hypothetical protein
LDAEGTVEYFCDTGVLTPVMRPGVERWFDVDVLIDTSPSMAVWQDTALELASLLERHGAFREVRHWALEQVDAKVRLSGAAGARFEALQLVDPDARRLTMIVADCIGPMWYQAPIWDAIRAWGLFSPVVIVTMLPSRLWPRTALGSPQVAMRSHRPGTANKSLDVTLPWWWPNDDPPPSAMPVPVITLEADPMSAWARMVMGAGGVETLGVFARPPAAKATVRSGDGLPDAEKQVQQFRVTVSPVAYRLAVYLSAALRGRWGLAIARVVQEVMLPDSSQVHLAEVIVGGLVRRADGHIGDGEPMFEFVDGVVDVLQRSLTGTEALRVLQALGGHIERETGHSSGIAAMLLGETAPADAAEQFDDVQAAAANLIQVMGLAPVDDSGQLTDLLTGPAVSAPLAGRLVEVIADRGESAAARYRHGSGCIVAGRTVLTAAHVVAEAVKIQVRDPNKRLYSATVDPRFVGDANGPGPDLALLEIDDPAVDLPPIGLAQVYRDGLPAQRVERVHVIGYPWFAAPPTATEIRDTVDIIGVIPLLSRLAAGLLSVQVSISPRPLPPVEKSLAESEWSGMSGGPVVAAGRLLGVVSVHAPREGPSAITAVPLTALEQDPAHPGWGPGVKDPVGWWARLGISGLADLQWLPPAYWATVWELGRTLRQRMPQLFGREQELAEIAAFATGPPGYRWLVGGAYAGKTALLLEAVTAGLPDEVDVVCYFLSRPSDGDSSRFLAAVVPQLAYLCEMDPPAADRDQFYALWRRAAERAADTGRPLLLVVDGLDEDTRPAGLPSVASLLPTVVEGWAHVLVASRPNPELPIDVPSGHPLTTTDPLQLQPFQGAQELAELGRQEINNLIHGVDDDTAVDVLGLLTAAEGPLSLSDLAVLSNDLTSPSAAHSRRVRRLVTEQAARILEPIGSPEQPRYQFAHFSLLEYAQATEALSDPAYRRRIERWADQWRDAGWPAPGGGESTTPLYLLDSYPLTLENQPTRFAALVGDVGWVSAAVQTVGVDAVLATLNAAQSAGAASAEVSALVAALRAQAPNLRPPQPIDQPGYVLRQLATQAAELGEDRLAADARARLQALFEEPGELALLANRILGVVQARLDAGGRLTDDQLVTDIENVLHDQFEERGELHDQFEEPGELALLANRILGVVQARLDIGGRLTDDQLVTDIENVLHDR